MKFRIESPEQLAKLQEVLFKLGYKWYGGSSDEVRILPKVYGLVAYDYEDSKGIDWVKCSLYFDRHINKEINTAEFISLHSKPSLQRHKHYDVIVAAAEGKTIQCRGDARALWQTFEGKEALRTRSWRENHEYRVKPEPVEMWQFAFGLKSGETATTIGHFPDEGAMRLVYASSELEWVVKLEPTSKLVEPE